MSELEPCPFCGSNHRCYLSGGTNNMYETRHLAIEAWHTRVEPPELATLREQVKMLREALGKIADATIEGIDGDEWFNEIANIALEQTKPKDEDPEKLAKLIASRVNGFGLSSAHKLVFRFRTLDNIINAEPADLDAIFGKGSIKSIHLRKYLDDPVAVERLREGLQTKPKEGE